MNEKSEQLMKRTKTLTLTLAIIFTIASILSVFGSIGMTISQSIDYSELGLSAEDIETLSAGTTPAMVYMTYLIALVTIVVTVFLYIYNAKLKKGKLVNKVPYLGVAAIQLYSIVNGIMGIIRMGSVGIASSLPSLIINLIILGLAVMAVMNLFKLDNEKV